MLRDQQSRLLTAYVDGELDAQDRQVVEQLLAASSEARAFLAKLENDSKDLQALPVHKAPETLADVVMDTVNDHPSLPTLQQKIASPSSWPAIQTKVGIGVAASVLLAVSVAAFFAAGGLLRKWQSQGPIAAEQRPGIKKEVAVEPRPKTVDPFHADLVAQAAKDFGNPVQASDAGVRLLVKELHLPAGKARLAGELRRSAAFLFDAPAANPFEAVNRFKEAFNKADISIVVEGGAKASLEKKLPKIGYMLYAEDLREEEIARVFHFFATAEAASVTATVVERIVMKPLSESNRKDVAGAMHVAMEKLAPAQRPSGDFTAFTDAPPGTSKSGAPVQGPPRAILMTETGADAQSEDLRRFLNSRSALRPGTVQFVLLIHEPPG